MHQERQLDSGKRRRHWTRVLQAARRAGYCDSKGLLDQWVAHWLKTCRREALAVLTQDEVDEATMLGLTDFGGDETQEC